MNKKDFLLILLLATVLLGIYLLGKSQIFPENLKGVTPEKIASRFPVVTPTPSPTSRPLTFAEMNTLYGPCVNLPTLMYHHVQDSKSAEEKNQTSLTVTPEYFKKQMQYLKDNGYKTVYMSDLMNFFDGMGEVPKKSVLITFDDGYDDFATDAIPILREFSFTTTVFLPTGLMDNPEYLTWNTIRDLAKAGDVVFANHTWSHRNVAANKIEVEREIRTGDAQLDEKGFNSPKLFAYPYGLESEFAEELLDSLGYKLAFTTRSGSTLCKKQRLDLPRIRVGNTSLATYGF